MGKIGKIGLGQQIRKEFESSKQFMLEMADYVKEDGLFIPTGREIEEGTVIHFNFLLPSGRHILKGTGKVEEVARKPPFGWYIKFLELDDRSKKNLSMILEWKRKHGKL